MPTWQGTLHVSPCQHPGCQMAAGRGFASLCASSCVERRGRMGRAIMGSVVAVLALLSQVQRTN